MYYNTGMSWAMRRRIMYLAGVAAFFIIVFGLPIAYRLLSVPPTCVDGEQNQNETSPDRGGPCPLVDTSKLSPSSVLWSRPFKIREGSYSATSYIQNPNEHAGVTNISYLFRLYDSTNLLVAERTGETFVMPGGVTPVYEPDIDTGQRGVTRAFFQFTSQAQWLNLTDLSKDIQVSDRVVSNETSVPRLEAKVQNTSVSTMRDIAFVATVFDTAGNAFASSATKIDRLEAGETRDVVFTWPNPFTLQVGRVDILPVLAPKTSWKAPCAVENGQVTCSN